MTFRFRYKDPMIEGSTGEENNAERESRLRDNRRFIERILATGTAEEVKILKRALDDSELDPSVCEIIRDVWSKLDCVACSSGYHHYIGRKPNMIFDYDNYLSDQDGDEY